MTRANPDPPTGQPTPERWPVIKVSVPPAWKTWLDEAAAVRGLAVAALVRQCIRDLMIRRHEGDA